ncbi:MAG: hypothetical protein WBO16_11500, partial [Gammaproteobacteria bacterium]
MTIPTAYSGAHITVTGDEDGSTRVSHIEQCYTFAHELRNTARVMSHSARDSKDTYWEKKAFINGAIILSYASLEATYNEIIHLSAFSAENSLSETEQKIISTISSEELEARGSNTLQKYNLLLRILDKPEIKSGDVIYQAANYVRILRNMLIHPIPGRVVTYTEDDDFD